MALITTAPAGLAPTAPAPVATPAISAPATAPVFARPGLIDRERTPSGVLAIQCRDGGLGFLVRLHLDETEALGSARIPIHDDLSRLHRAVGFEHLFEVPRGHGVAQIADVQLSSHCRLHEKEAPQVWSVSAV